METSLNSNVSLNISPCDSNGSVDEPSSGRSIAIQPSRSLPTVFATLVSLMNKKAPREDIETIVRFVPRPLLSEKLLPKNRNLWLILDEYENGEGIVVLNSITNHEGKLPYDSIREFRKPDILILRAQVILGKDGQFSFEVVADTPDQEIPDEVAEMLPERISHAQAALAQCTPEQCRGIKELLIREKMSNSEMKEFCSLHGIPDGYKFFSNVNSRTSFLEKVGDSHTYQMWIKPGFVPILRKLLLDSQKLIPFLQSS